MMYVIESIGGSSRGCDFISISNSALEARFNEVSLSSPTTTTNATGAAASGTTTEPQQGGEEGGLQAALAQARGENEQLIGKMRELLARHKALQKSAGEFKAQGEEAAGCVRTLVCMGGRALIARMGFGIIPLAE